MSYNFKEVDEKWQDIWSKKEVFKTGVNIEKPKCYVLDMFPYPSGKGLHVGHPKGYIATDVYSRYKSLKGFNVLHPMGWDAFGLPAENYALKNKVHPSIATNSNIKRFKEQLKVIGFNHDWEREINTTDSDFYKWTQWIFIKLYNYYYDKDMNKAMPIDKLIKDKYNKSNYYELNNKQKEYIDSKRLAYESYEPINWCPSCKTGLANEDLEDGKCERCGTEVEQKPLRQWVLRITEYADRMLEDLSSLNWENMIKESQRNWIGRSKGAELDFNIKDSDVNLRVFTTRPDTLFGVTYMVVAPEHPLVEKFKSKILNMSEIEEYKDRAKKKTAFERVELAKDKTGVEIKGLKVINPVNNKEIPVWVSDYVMMGYGTGAIMAVPAHDTRDYEFAKKFDIDIIQVIDGNSIDEEAYVGDGKHINSEFLDGLNKEDAINKMIKWLEDKNIGKTMTNYRLQDWVFSRQRYWGEPIPMIRCEKCGNVPLNENKLPLKLPEVEHYEPSGTGESPLAGINEWVDTICPICGQKAKRETNTMPQWAGSSWYYLRYIDPNNNDKLVDSDKEKYWMNVDLYVGGAEHATRHLIYARFWHKFLYDIGAVSTIEPFDRLQHVGLVLAEDGKKISKRSGNGASPDEIVNEFGADTLRVYEMFMGDFKKSVAWSTNGVKGSKRFLDRVSNLSDIVNEKNGYSNDLENLINKTIKKVGEDIEEFKFNTAIAALMTLLNEFISKGDITIDEYKTFIMLLNPFAPHLTEELWSKLESCNMLVNVEWPKYDESKLVDDNIEMPIQINGKVKGKVIIGKNEEKESVLEKARNEIKEKIQGKEIVKEIYVQGKILNIVVK